MAAAPVSAPSQRHYRDEFPIFRQTIYLNSCSLGALSRRSRARVNEYLDLWERQGAAAWYDAWWTALGELRERYGRLIGAAGGDIALHPSISAALTSAAEALDYRGRRKVVVSRLDFPTLAYQWLARSGEGVELVLVDSPDGVQVPLEAFERAVDERTALVATSHVFFTSGAIQDVAAVAEIAHRRGALLLVDGYQAAGQLPVDVRRLDADFYCGGGLKWLLGGSGIAFLYIRPELGRRLASRATGWFAHREQFRFDPEQLALHDDARRFEVGTPAMAAVYAQLGGSMCWTSWGRGRCAARPWRSPRISSSGTRRGSPAQGCRRAGIEVRNRHVAQRRSGAGCPAVGAGGHRHRRATRPRARVAILLQHRR